MAANDNEFIAEVARARMARVKERRGEFQMSGASGDVPWTVDLSAPSTSAEGDPSWGAMSFCSTGYIFDAKRAAKETMAALKAGRTPVTPVTVVFGFRRTMHWSNLLFFNDRSAWYEEDPYGVLAGELRERVANWPVARWHDGEVRPALPSQMYCDDGGVRLRTSGWWASAAALGHLIDLGVALTVALRTTAANVAAARGGLQ